MKHKIEREYQSNLHKKKKKRFKSNMGIGNFVKYQLSN